MYILGCFFHASLCISLHIPIFLVFLPLNPVKVVNFCVYSCEIGKSGAGYAIVTGESTLKMAMNTWVGVIGRGPELIQKITAIVARKNFGIFSKLSRKTLTYRKKMDLSPQRPKFSLLVFRMRARHSKYFIMPIIKFVVDAVSIRMVEIVFISRFRKWKQPPGGGGAVRPLKF